MNSSPVELIIKRAKFLLKSAEITETPNRHRKQIPEETRNISCENQHLDLVDIEGLVPRESPIGLAMIYVLARRCLEKTSKVSLMRFLFSVPICPLCKCASLLGSSSGVLLAEGVRLRRPSSRSGSATSNVNKGFLTTLKRKSHRRNQRLR
jgi:hypothetical protein